LLSDIQALMSGWLKGPAWMDLMAFPNDKTDEPFISTKNRPR